MEELEIIQKVFCAEIQNGILFILPLAHDLNYALYPDDGYYRLQKNHAVDQIPFLPRASTAVSMTILKGKGEICFRCISLLMEDKWLLTMVTIRLLGWARPSLQEWSSYRFIEMNASCYQQLSSSSD